MKSYFYMALQQQQKAHDKNNAAGKSLKGGTRVVVRPEARVRRTANGALLELQRAGVTQPLLAHVAIH
jgi:preprotein translocase subunit YajC